ncbi:MAG: LCP family protein [Cyanobacteria bacterium P01_F01_bin.33]
MAELPPQRSRQSSRPPSPTAERSSRLTGNVPEPFPPRDPSPRPPHRTRAVSPNRDRPQSSRFTLRWFLWRGIAVLFVGLLAGACVRLVTDRFLDGPILSAETSPAELEDACTSNGIFCADDGPVKALDRPLSILVLGVDNPDPSQRNLTRRQMLRGRSDTILVVRVNPDTDAINVLSIPRDTRVRFPARGIGKINSANALGGPTLVAEMVQNLLSEAPVDRYVRLSTDGISALVDAMGGVNFYVEKDMVYDDHTQNLHINLKQGQQRLNGEQVHQYLRFRQDELGDIGRVQRQQKLMRAVSRQLLRPTTLLRLPKIKQAIVQNVDTNMSWEELLPLVQFALNNTDSTEDRPVTPASNEPDNSFLRLPAVNDKLNLVLLPGRFSQPGEFGNQSYWVIDPVATYNVATNLFGGIPDYGNPNYRSLEKQRIAVQNASGLPDMAGNMAKNLRQKGFTNIIINADASRAIATTQILAQRGDTATALEVQALLGFGEIRVQSTGDITSDVTVRVGSDWAEFWYPDVADQKRQTRRSNPKALQVLEQSQIPSES